MIILFLYRRGDNGNFLGAGAVWNLKEDKNEDVEILASGVFIGFFVYNLSVLITYCLTSEKSLNVRNAHDAFSIRTFDRI